MTKFYQPDLTHAFDNPFVRDGNDKLIRRSYWLDMDDRTVVMESRQRTWADVSAGPEIREGYEPHRREPVAAHLPHPAGPGGVLVRRRAERTEYIPGGGNGSVACLCDRLSRHVGRTRAHQGLHAESTMTTDPASYDRRRRSSLSQ
jgi:hypothetical protein